MRYDADVRLKPRHLNLSDDKLLPIETYNHILDNYFPLFLMFAYAYLQQLDTLKLIGYKEFLSEIKPHKTSPIVAASTALVQMQKLILVLPRTLKPLIPFW